MAPTATPQLQLLTVNNTTGANLVPLSTCTEIRIVEDAGAVSFDFSLTINGNTVTYPKGTKEVLRPNKGTSFAEGVVIGLLKGIGGTLVIQIVEVGG